MKLRHFLIVCVIAILGITATVFATTKYFPPGTQALGPLDLDVSDGATETVTVDFIWPQGSVGSVKLEKVEGLHVYVCGLEGVNQSESDIVCEIRFDSDGHSVGGTMRKKLHAHEKTEKPTADTT